jgi:hypothetical protein
MGFRPPVKKQDGFEHIYDAGFQELATRIEGMIDEVEIMAGGPIAQAVATHLKQAAEIARSSSPQGRAKPTTIPYRPGDIWFD